MSQPTSAAPSRKKTMFSLLVLAALTGIIVLLFKPTGFLGRKVQEKV